MFEKFTNRISQSWEGFQTLPTQRKILMGGVVASVIASFIILLVLLNQTDYQVLYSGLSEEDAAAVVAKLKEDKTPYEIKDNSTIAVPKEILQETRLSLATAGLPAGGGIGMEMFDETRLGETDFLQHLNYQRAVQGELERTIKKFPQVGNVRVHLNMPKESLFIEDSRKPSASVVLSLKRGQSLSRGQLAGIVHLVASSVERLDAENVSIVDTAGGLLYSKDESEGAVLSEAQNRHRRQIEQSLTDRLTIMLERVVGPDKALARVTADLNYQQIHTAEEVYDPDRTAIRSEQRLNESSQGPGRGASGVPNATFELGTGDQQTAGGGTGTETYNKSEETTNYEITKINRQVLIPAGEVKKLSVAVMVDGIYQDVQQGEQTVKQYSPRPDAELAQLEQLVRNAVGFDEARGDTVVVSSVPFYTEAEEVLPLWKRILEQAQQYGKPVFNILLMVLFFLFVVRPVMGWLQRETTPEAPPIEMAALPEGEEEIALPEPGKPEKGRLTREQALNLAQQNPERTINLIRAWIEEK